MGATSKKRAKETSQREREDDTTSEREGVRDITAERDNERERDSNEREGEIERERDRVRDERLRAVRERPSESDSKEWGGVLQWYRNKRKEIPPRRGGSPAPPAPALEAPRGEVRAAAGAAATAGWCDGGE